VNVLEELADAARSLSALVWPGPCFACGEDLPGRAIAGACPRCWAALPVRIGPGCPRCDLPGNVPLTPASCPDCRGGGPELRGTVAAFVYDDPRVALHRRLKFGGALELAPPLAARMSVAWDRRAPGTPDVVVAVPPDPLRWTPRRRVPRLLAKAVGGRLGLPFVRRALVKVRPTRSLTGRTAAARRTALEGAFRARPELVAGRRILVVDDVATTGATLREAARALAAAGARDVFGLVLARTPASV
jgi:predicted amidophosphoribosyltransferase